MDDEIAVLEKVIRARGDGAAVHVVGHSCRRAGRARDGVRGSAPLASLT
jgi:hypothetical protein